MSCSKLKTANTAAEKIPLDLLREILLQLPVKSLLRFRSVCKSWRKLIRDPSFIKSHTRISQDSVNSNNQFLCERTDPYSGYPEFTLRCSDSLAEQQMVMNFPYGLMDLIDGNWDDGSFYVASCCRGLICICVRPMTNFALSFDPFPSGIFLWNPLFCKYKILPQSPNGDLYLDACVVAVGFGFVFSDTDYRVVWVHQEEVEDDDNHTLIPGFVDVYHLSSNSWSTVQTDVPVSFSYNRSHFFLNGAIHWSAWSPSDDDLDFIIAAFDLEKEVFQVIVPPRNSETSCEVAVLGDLLAVVFGELGLYDIWVMKDYGVADSWTKQFVFNLNNICRALGVLKVGQILLRVRDPQQEQEVHLVSYDSDTKEVTDLHIDRVISLVPYVQSLTLLDLNDDASGL